MPVQETVIDSVGIINPDDFSLGVDAFGFRALAAWGIDQSNVATGSGETVLVEASPEFADDLSPGINALWINSNAAWCIDCCVDAAAVKEPVLLAAAAILVNADNLSLVVDAIDCAIGAPWGIDRCIVIG